MPVPGMTSAIEASTTDVPARRACSANPYMTVMKHTATPGTASQSTRPPTGGEPRRISRQHPEQPARPKHGQRRAPGYEEPPSLHHPLLKRALLCGRHCALVKIANDQELDSGVALPLDWKISFRNVCSPDLGREISEKLESGRLVLQSQQHRLDRKRGGQRYFAARHLSPRCDQTHSQGATCVRNEDIDGYPLGSAGQ